MLGNLDHGFKSRLCNFLAAGRGHVAYPALPASFHRAEVPGVCVERIRHSCAVFGSSDRGMVLAVIPKAGIHPHSLYRSPLFSLSTGDQTQDLIQARPVRYHLPLTHIPLVIGSTTAPASVPDILSSWGARPLVLFSLPPPKTPPQGPPGFSFSQTRHSTASLGLFVPGSGEGRTTDPHLCLYLGCPWDWLQAAQESTDPVSARILSLAC